MIKNCGKLIIRRKRNTSNMQTWGGKRKRDLVLLQQKHKKKYSTNFRLDPLEVVQVKGSQIIMKDNSGKTYRQNSSHVKKFLKPDEEEEEVSIDKEELEGEVEDA
ncbi:Hypothetical predicted protein [Paramuricea clavata]|uniref:Uncharacterized protein n=1 Tax=Paramuricea clavata TaxID=317549 RepID=A0A6S7FMZ1_PARCT|nr:Hypothetical predicted protein [Paramuricea clavata]